MSPQSPYKTLLAAMTLALGLIIAAVVVSHTAYRIAANRQSIVVKGLAEKRVDADHARWSIKLSQQAPTLKQSFEALRADRPKLQAFLQEQGFPPETLELGREGFYAIYKLDEQRRQTREIEAYLTYQEISVASKDVKKINLAASKIVGLQEAGLSLNVKSPEFFVSTLETVKMSLIADATRNAYQRASEFAKTGGARVGTMKSATQGAFYILAADSSSEDSDYGGVYDKSTIEKIARVVVTIEYALTE